jgi:hypothetical protein
MTHENYIKVKISLIHFYWDTAKPIYLHLVIAGVGYLSLDHTACLSQTT